MKQKTDRFSTWIPYLFFFYKEKVFRKLLPLITLVSLYAFIVVYADRTPGYIQKIANSNLGQFNLIISFILTIIINFRVNASYSRWLEGRLLWGAITNNCRNIGLKFDAFVGLKNNPEFYALLQNLPLIIKAHLRKDKQGIAPILQTLNIHDCQLQPVLQVIKRMYQIINELRTKETLSLEQYLALDTHLANLIDQNGGCERLANTPTPPAFAIFVKQTLLFYTLMFPFGWADTFGFLIIPIMIIIVYILLGLELLSEELEEPFATDKNGLKLTVISNNIANDIEHIAETDSIK